MEDVQNRADNRGVPIDRVGIKGIKYPVAVLDRTNGKQSTIATIDMSIELSESFRGTHMSRFVEVLNKHRKNFVMRRFTRIVRDIKKHLNARSAQLELSFPYFIERLSPVSKSPSLMEYNAYILISSRNHDAADIVIGVIVPITTVCPCSKEISELGAHNQRAIVTIKVRMQEFIWLEELIEVAESSASCEIYPLLKREDEKHVTEKAYSNPVFVEDVVRNVAVNLKADARIKWFHVGVESFESIHNHNAFAELEWTRNDLDGQN